MQREKLGTRLGFILLSAGCAIGIGNVWKFPYMVGQNGGGIFVLIYLIFLVILGLPVLTMEISLGRASQKSPVKLYNELEPKGSKWHLHGIIAMLGNYILMMFYTTVSGFMLQYVIRMANGDFVGLNKAQVSDVYDNMLSSPMVLTVFTVSVIIVGFLVCSFSLQGGLEKITKYMMIALLVIMIVLAVNSIVLDTSGNGLKFYLLPSIENMKKVGLGQVLVSAMNQSFFTLSLGMGSMAIFGSYIDKKRSLLGESVNVAALDTFVAFTSGLIIFPACHAFNVDVDAGPPLIFKTLPNIFAEMPLGRVWGSLFFLFLSFAALSTVFAVFENIVSCTRDLTGMSRKKACLINCILMIVLSLPCILGFNVFKDFMPFGKDSNIMDLEDFIVSNLLLPIGSLIFVLFCTSKRGWGWKNFVNEANEGKGLKIKNWMRGYVTYVLPILILIILIWGIVDKLV